MKSKFITLQLGIKKNKTDGLLICLTDNNNTQIISTLNKFAAAPIIISKKNIAKSNPKYIFINSGNANACTGKEGLDNANKILKTLALKLDCKKHEIIFMSTGIIGRQLPLQKICHAITNNKYNKYVSLKKSAMAIMTTDKFPKYLTKSYIINTKKITFRGICKGAGMIEPNMATMLAFIETDVKINKGNLKKYLQYCANLSFNSISVDGDMSTNDCVAFTSNNNVNIDLHNKKNLTKFLECATDFFISLSSLIVKDGEGATKIIELNIINSKSLMSAQKISRKISHSLLVKTAMYGQDPNWGRIIASLGSVDDLALNISKVKLLINDILCFSNGVPKDNGSKKLANSMKKNNIKIIIDLGVGKHSQSLYFSDLSHEYVHINSAYTT
jgi:glutamate N-acetyltransferase/amino-acid N-acetyltransferase